MIKRCVFCDCEFLPSKKIVKYCTLKCVAKHKRELYIKNWYLGNEFGGNGFELSHHIRNYLMEQNNYKCSQCGWGELNNFTKKNPLHIDHISGDPFDHSPNNLRVLCPNCHSLTETYGAHNRGNGRYSRGTSHPKHTIMENIKV